MKKNFWNGKFIPGCFTLLAGLSLLLISCEPEADTTAPEEVSNLSVSVDSDSAVITWTDPDDLDFSSVKLLVTSGEVHYDESFTVDKGVEICTLSNLSNLTVYSLTIYTVDTSGNLSDGISKKFTTLVGSGLAAPETLSLSVIDAEKLEGQGTFADPYIMEKGGSISFSLTVTPDDADISAVKVYAGKKLLSADDKGYFIFTSSGTGVVDVYAYFPDDYIYSKRLYVKVCCRVDSIKLSGDYSVLSLNASDDQGSMTLVPAYYDADGNSIDFSDINVSTSNWYSSDSSVAVVDDAGFVEAAGTGSAVITYTVNEVSCTYDVQVISKIPYVTEFAWNKSQYFIPAETDMKLDYTLTPAEAADFLTIEFYTDSSHKTKAVDVALNEDGSYTFGAVGNYYPRAVYKTGKETKKYSYSCNNSTVKITVQDKLIDFSIDVAELNLCYDETQEFNITLNPSTAYSDDMICSSNNSKISVTGSGEERKGKITASSAEDDVQSAEISVTLSGITKKINVSVYQKVTGLTLSSNLVVTGETGEKNIGATVIPENATYPEVTWTSSNEEVAVVDDGKITVKKSGTAAIKAVTRDGISSVVNLLALDIPDTITMADESELKMLTGSDSEKYEGYVTDSAGLVAYKYTTEAHADNTGLPSGTGKWDIIGNSNGAWKSSTYADAGWGYAINDNVVSLNSDGTAYDGDVSLMVKPYLIYDDGIPYVLFVHVLTNNGAADLTEQKFGSFTDIQIADNDKAPVNVTEYGANLKDEASNMIFNMNLFEGFAVTPASTMWVGNYKSCVYKHIYTDKRESVSDIDSALAYSWTDIDLATGETKIFTSRLTFVVDQGGTLEVLVY